MKIAAKATEGVLAKPGQYRLALLYGPDSGLTRDRVQRMTKAFLGDPYDPMAYSEFDEAKLLSDPALLADELGAVSMLAPKRVLHIRDAGDKIAKLLEESAAFFNDDVFVIVSSGELGTRSSLRSWAERAPQAAAIASYRDELRDVQDIIRQKLGTQGIRLDAQAMEYLASQLGNDRYVTYQELEKIITYAGEQKSLDVEELEALVDYNRDMQLDDIVNAVADRNLETLERMLALHLRQGTQPIAYLRALQRYFNRLYLLKAQVLAGQSAQEVVAALRPPVFFRQVPVLTRHVQNWSLEAIIKALGLLVCAELACKSSDLPPAPASHRRLMQVAKAR